MADPLSVIASAVGVIAFTAQTARMLVTLTSEINDAPEEILHVRRDAQSLAAVLQTVQEVCSRSRLGPEDHSLVESLTEYVGLCQSTMLELRRKLQSFSSSGSPRRSPLKIIGWTLRKGEIKALRERLQEGKASLSLTLLALKGLVDGKGQDEIKAEVNKVYSRLVLDFRSIENGRRIKGRIEDDLSSVSNFGTDADMPLRRYLQAMPEQAEPLELSDNNAEVLWAAPTTALLEAVKQRNLEAVTALINSGVLLSERSDEGYTAMHYCAIYDEPEIAEVLISSGADLNPRDYQLRSPLQVALASESFKTATLLLQRNCSLGETPRLMYDLAKVSDELPGVDGLIKALGVRLNKAARGPYLLQNAIARNDFQVLEFLCESGFDVNAKDDCGIPPLCQAIMQQKGQAFDILLRYDVDLTQHVDVDDEGLLDENIDWHRELKKHLGPGTMPLMLAANTFNNAAWTRILLEKGADPNFEFKDGGVILMAMCATYFLDAATALVEGGTHVNQRNDEGHTPLYWASRCNNNALMRLLLEHGANINIMDNWGWTPLHLAGMDGHSEIAKIALEYGADTTLKNSDGEIAAEVAKRHGQTDIVELIEEARERTMFHG